MFGGLAHQVALALRAIGVPAIVQDRGRRRERILEVVLRGGDELQLEQPADRFERLGKHDVFQPYTPAILAAGPERAGEHHARLLLKIWRHIAPDRCAPYKRNPMIEKQKAGQRCFGADIWPIEVLPRQINQLRGQAEANTQDIVRPNGLQAAGQQRKNRPREQNLRQQAAQLDQALFRTGIGEPVGLK